MNTWCWKADKKLRRMSSFVRSPLGRLLYKGLNASPRWIIPAALGKGHRMDRQTHAQYTRPFSRWVERTAPWTLGVELAGSDAYYEALWARRTGLANVPMTLVWGEADPAFGVAYLERWRDAFPQAAVESWPDVGHFPAEEVPERVSRAIRGALQAVTLPPEIASGVQD
jgi:haloalkane dehalogenase